jgi:hypothetical protein
VRTKDFKIDFEFLSLQSWLWEIFLSNGGNNYNIAHIGEGRLLRSGTLPACITALAHACVVAREVNGELDGMFEEDAKGAVHGTVGKYINLPFRFELLCIWMIFIFMLKLASFNKAGSKLLSPGKSM